MKHSPKTYAQMLTDTDEKSDTKKIAKNFWHLLQKNKQYKDLGKILEELDIISSEKENKLLIKVFCERFEDDFESTYTAKIEQIVGQKIKFKKIIKAGVDSPVFMMNDEIIDLSTKNLISKLQIKLKSGE